MWILAHQFSSCWVLRLKQCILSGIKNLWSWWRDHPRRSYTLTEQLEVDDESKHSSHVWEMHVCAAVLMLWNFSHLIDSRAVPRFDQQAVLYNTEPRVRALKCTVAPLKGISNQKQDLCYSSHCEWVSNWSLSGALPQYLEKTKSWKTMYLLIQWFLLFQMNWRTKGFFVSCKNNLLFFILSKLFLKKPIELKCIVTNLKQGCVYCFGDTWLSWWRYSRLCSFLVGQWRLLALMSLFREKSDNVHKHEVY